MTYKIILTLTLIGTLLNSCDFLKMNENQKEVDKLENKTEVQKKPFTSIHIFTANYDGVNFHKCMGRTAECPDKCGESGNLAKFNVKEYKDHIVNGEAGIEKLNSYSFLISDYFKKDLNSPYINELKNLKKGDEVTIHLEYVYDTRKSTIETVENIISITKNI